MAYYPNDRGGWGRQGGGWNGGGRQSPPRNNYNNRGGWGGPPDDGYPPQQQYRQRDDRYVDQAPMDFKYSIGQRCALKYNPEQQVVIIRLGREQYECRLPNLSTDWFYEHELVPIDE